MLTGKYAWTGQETNIDALDIAMGVPGRGKRERRIEDFL
jgi:hypothetical protein